MPIFLTRVKFLSIVPFLIFFKKKGNLKLYLERGFKIQTFRLKAQNVIFQEEETEEDKLSMF